MYCRREASVNMSYRHGFMQQHDGRIKYIFNLKKKLDGYIVWNAHNTVFGWKRSAIGATVYVGVSKDDKWSK